MATSDPTKLKVLEPEEIEDIELPIQTQWEGVINRPTSLSDLDQDAQDDIDDIETTLLTLGDLAYLNNITETEITDNAVTTPKIFAGAVTASKISVGDLSAISANIGAITAGTIAGVTITGGTIQTSTSGYRLVMSGSDNAYQFRNGSTLLAELVADIVPNSGTAGALLYHPTDNAYLGVSGSAGGGWSGLGGSGGFLAVTSGISTSQIETDLRLADHWLPQTSGSYNLGSTTYRWGNIYANGARFYGHVLPNQGGIYNLGSSSLNFGSLYLATIYKGSTLQMNFGATNYIQSLRPHQMQVRSGTPGSAGSYQGCWYYDTSKQNMVFSDGTGWFEVQASAY